MARKARSKSTKIRGVSPAQYQALRRMIERGEVTWQELEQQGVVEPPRNQSDFIREVKQRLSGNGKDGSAQDSAGRGAARRRKRQDGRRRS